MPAAAKLPSAGRSFTRMRPPSSSTRRPLPVRRDRDVRVCPRCRRRESATSAAPKRRSRRSRIAACSTPGGPSAKTTRRSRSRADGRLGAPTPFADDRLRPPRSRSPPGAARRDADGAIRLPRDGRVAGRVDADLRVRPFAGRELHGRAEGLARAAPHGLDHRRRPIRARPGQRRWCRRARRRPRRPAPSSRSSSARHGGSHDGDADAAPADASSAPAQSTIRKAERLTTARHPSPSRPRRRPPRSAGLPRLVLADRQAAGPCRPGPFGA